MTPRVLEDYKDLICDTTVDLKAHLASLEERVQSIGTGSLGGSPSGDDEWMAMLEEKESTQQGLRICAQLSAQIEQLEPTSTEHPQFMQRPSAHKYVKHGLSATKNSIDSLVARLQAHEDDINKQMEAMRSASPLSPSAATQLAALQETKESLHQCIKVVSEADKTLVVERRNIFEDITMVDNAYDFSVSTIGDLVTARRINLSGQARHVGGQISDESFQMSMQALTQLDMGREKTTPTSDEDVDQAIPTDYTRSRELSSDGFSGRYGKGVALSPQELRPTQEPRSG